MIERVTIAPGHICGRLERNLGSSRDNSRGENPTILEVLWAFLKLGLRSFGGPIAHIGYFRQEFVVRRRWLEDSAFSDLVALCQFLPGAASSQVGFSIGLMRAGYGGGLAAAVMWCCRCCATRS